MESVAGCCSLPGCLESYHFTGATGVAMSPASGSAFDVS